MNQNKTAKYFKYAIGEIILVVIGILIALQVNNWNENRVEHKSELKYLKNIKLDLQSDLETLKEQIDKRKEKLVVYTRIIAHINGDTIKDIEQLSKNVYATIMEERFTPNNSTYDELTGSGNLSLIENDTIKKLLLELQKIYKSNEFAIEHEAFEYKEYINKSLFKYADLDKLKPIYNQEKTALDQNISFDDFNALFKSKEYKNGLVVSSAISKGFIPLYEQIKLKSETIIDLINKNIIADND